MSENASANERKNANPSENEGEGEDEGKSPEPGFADFSLDPRIVQAVATLGFEKPTPIQAATFPPLLEGKDLIGRARTGSGKTAAFGLPLLHRLKDGGRHVRALLLCPTRELALQVTEELRSYAKRLPIEIVTIYGGAPYEPQLRALRAGAQVVVGTPGRVIDHIDRGTLKLDRLEVLVLDEADEMLRMGFIDDVEKILASAPAEKQVALFSATMPNAIQSVAKKHLQAPVQIQVEKRALTTSHIAQRALKVPPRFKVDALARILAVEEREATLVFTRTRRGCAEVADALSKRGIAVDALHGDLNQAARERVLSRLRSENLDVVIATDVASRGIDVKHITHVINLDMPDDVEVYTHRIGRTGRAGRPGTAITFLHPREGQRMARFERALGVEIEPMQIPSDAEIEKRQHDRLKQRLLSTLEAGSSPALKAWLSEECQDLDLSAIAEAALTLLCNEVGIQFTENVNTRPPSWAAPPPRGGQRDQPGGRDRERAQAGPPPAGRHASGPDVANAVELYAKIGRFKGVEARHVVAALTNGLGIPGSHIGRIKVLNHETFIGVSQEAGDAFKEHGGNVQIKGTPVQRGQEGGLERDDDRSEEKRPKKPRKFRGGGAAPKKRARGASGPSGGKTGSSKGDTGGTGATYKRGKRGK